MTFCFKRLNLERENIFVALNIYSLARSIPILYIITADHRLGKANIYKMAAVDVSQHTIIRRNRPGTKAAVSISLQFRFDIMYLTYSLIF